MNIQTHYGKGDIVGRDKIAEHKNQQHKGTGDNVQGDKTMFISVPIRWTIVAFLCASFFAWYFIWGIPDKMPKANFEYYTEGAKDKVALAGQVVIFNDLSEDAHSIKWTFPNGETFTEKKVLWTFKYYGEYTVKLEAFSRKGKVNEKL
ncbi:MAG: PKD domain-containing protein [Saprospirales bacterium]|nr:PKD domain-containing protein [Saprospirales bacterium]